MKLVPFSIMLLALSLGGGMVCTAVAAPDPAWVTAAVDAQLPITFADPALESRRQAEATKAQAKRRPGVPLSARSRRHIAGTACARWASSTGCTSRAKPSGRYKRRPRPPRHRRRPKFSSRPGPRRPSWNSARRGYGRRWKPRRRNARRARSAGDDACEFSDVRLASELAARSYIAAS